MHQTLIYMAKKKGSTTLVILVSQVYNVSRDYVSTEAKHRRVQGLCSLFLALVLFVGSLLVLGWRTDFFSILFVLFGGIASFGALLSILRRSN